MLSIQPISFEEACTFVKKYHRHHKPTVSWKFGCAVNDGSKVVGVVVVGRPVSRVYDDGWTLEVTRCCTDGTPHVASKLYAAAWRAARALGYRKLITYTLESEPGTSVVAAGFRFVHKTKCDTWDTPARPRVDKHPIEVKKLWELSTVKETIHEYTGSTNRPG